MLKVAMQSWLRMRATGMAIIRMSDTAQRAVNDGERNLATTAMGVATQQDVPEGPLRVNHVVGLGTKILLTPGISAKIDIKRCKKSSTGGDRAHRGLSSVCSASSCSMFLIPQLDPPTKGFAAMPAARDAVVCGARLTHLSSASRQRERAFGRQRRRW